VVIKGRAAECGAGCRGGVESGTEAWDLLPPSLRLLLILLIRLLLKCSHRDLEGRAFREVRVF
jgi:hypothetical protein